MQIKAHDIKHIDKHLYHGAMFLGGDPKFFQVQARPYNEHLQDENYCHRKNLISHTCRGPWTLTLCLSPCLVTRNVLSYMYMYLFETCIE